jgi:hypothetical protein
MTLTRKIKQCKLTLPCIKVKKFEFSNMFKTWGRIRGRIWIQRKVGSGSASFDADLTQQCPLLCSVTCVQIFEKDFEDS